MELSLDRPGNHLFIRSVSEAGIQVADHLYDGPLILSSSELVSDWDVCGVDGLDEASLEPVFALRPEVVLLGTGSRQRFPDPRLLVCFHGRGIGIEVMATPAACRTFNVLVSERRNVVAALLPPGQRPER